MIKFLKKLFDSVFNREVLFNSSIIDGLTKNYVLNLEKFEKDWMSGDGTSDYTNGVNYEWLSPESVKLVNEEIHITSKHNPKTIENNRYENQTGMVTSIRFFFHGYYELLVDLPKVSTHIPTIELFNPDGNIELVCGNNKVSKIGFIYLPNRIEIYHDDILVKKITGGDIGYQVKMKIKNGLNPSVEGTRINDEESLILNGLTFYRKK